MNSEPYKKNKTYGRKCAKILLIVKHSALTSVAVVIIPCAKIDMKFGEVMSSCRTLPLNRSGERTIHGTFDAASARDV